MTRMTLLLVLSLHAWVAPVRSADRPNFVWLISEDNSKHFLKLFDEHGAETPAIEQLAAEGLTFEHAFSNSPVCSVARTTLITSCFAPRIGTQFHRRSVLVPMPAGLRMFPSYLREAGYYTTNRFKKDYNAIESSDVWDESSRKGSWRQRQEGQAFFHQQSFATSHESRLHFTANEMANQKTSTDPESVFVAPYHPDTATFRYTYARYHDRIRLVDQEIGQVVDQLREDQLLEDTFIFYFGDHGGVLPRGKGYAYESGLHVPLVVRIPANWQHLVPWGRGSSVKGFVSFVDFGPTLLQLAGIDIPDQVDGRPFLGSGISAAEVDSRQEAFGYADRFDEKYDFVRCLRHGRYEYLRSYQPFNFDGLQNNYRYRMLAFQEWRELFQRGELNDVQSQFFRQRPPEMLFDIEADPHETVNLANDPRYAETLVRLRTRMSERVKEMPDLSFLPESEFVEAASANPSAFGQRQQDKIARLVDIADLSLETFEAAAPSLTEAIASPHDWERYWALIVCSRFGQQATAFATQAIELAATDSNLLVRTRAAEFLGLSGLADPRPTILDALSKSRSPVEANLILNSLVVLRDGSSQIKFRLNEGNISSSIRQDENVARRLEYLVGESN